jgi:hypothetical protein
MRNYFNARTLLKLLRDYLMCIIMMKSELMVSIDRNDLGIPSNRAILGMLRAKEYLSDLYGCC